ncbi:MAG: fasciclin domain-containing protein [Chitinophagales bacterium]|nr:fasciclin domain-containing protein [Chitinophagales bacterium]HAE12835.1 fasciclin [Bacteroidota bacterium]MCB9019870.1 fasciclin domain-containing protein [Chitinophagales bacterium]MCB9020637.1 fasciclin domain-containing protein [Chitinophagales bacterium]HPE98924.1 fasciclin domain-containing protein [Chitinophagales bacterium]
MKQHIIGLFLPVAILLGSCGTTENGDETSGQGDRFAPGQSAVTDDVSQKNILQIAIASPDHTTLVAGVQAGDLVESLANAGPFTVFAPTNAAFEALPEGTLDDLLKPENKSALRNVLQYHVALSTFTIDNLEDGQILGMANGGNITITKNEDGQVSINGAKVLASVPASNGIVHVIDQVLIPQ